MDKLDKDIMEAKRDYSPSSNFTRETMHRINEEAVNKSRFGWIRPLLFSGVATLAVLAVVFSFTSMNNSNKGTQASNDATTKSNSAKQAQKFATAQPATPAKTVKTANPANQQTASDMDAQISQIDNEVNSSYVVNDAETNVEDVNL